MDLARYVFRPEPSSEELVVFVGDLIWPPNVEGIRWFLSEVWPILSRLRREARVEILGRGEGPLRALARRGPQGLSFLGEGADTRPLWRRAAVAIVPLLTGGGTRLKILEAAACGVPVVATPVGAEGLDFEDGPEIAVASGAPEFAAAIARPLPNPAQGASRPSPRAGAWRASTAGRRSGGGSAKCSGSGRPGMTALAAGLAGIALLLVVWSYLAYPALIARLSRRGQAAAPDHGAMPRSLEVVLSAADEEAVIGERVRNLVGQEIAVPFRISIGCDGCRDRTVEEARQVLGPFGRLVEFPERRGKAAVVNDLVRESDADVIVFTDANTRFDAGAVQRLAEVFRDPDVGAACGRLILEAGSARASAETAFWDRETRTKERRGASGFASAPTARSMPHGAWIEPLPRVRRWTTSHPRSDRAEGKRVVFAGEAVAREGRRGRRGRDLAALPDRRGRRTVLRQETWPSTPPARSPLARLLSRKAPVGSRRSRPRGPRRPLSATRGCVRPSGLLAAAALLPLLALAGPRPPRLPGFPAGSIISA